MDVINKADLQKDFKNVREKKYKINENKINRKLIRIIVRKLYNKIVVL